MPLPNIIIRIYLRNFHKTFVFNFQQIFYTIEWVEV